MLNVVSCAEEEEKDIRLLWLSISTEHKDFSFFKGGGEIVPLCSAEIIIAKS